MKTVGLITEYNPFHNGHLYHLQKAKELTSADYVTVLMSGNFVQRGTPAFADKYTRTRMALSQGADLVFELPVFFSTGSAEFFASGAVSILHQLGIIDTLCFGCELSDFNLLQTIAGILAEEPFPFKKALSHHLKKGLNFPSARKQALIDYTNNSFLSHSLADALDFPNNILAIEYLKALKQQNSSIQPYLLQRAVSAYHDTALNASHISSASSIRNTYIKNCNLDSLKNHVPEKIFSLLLETEGNYFPILEDDFSQALYYSISGQSVEELSSYMDVSFELARTMKKNIYHFKNFSSFATSLKSKQYTLTRIYRALLHILLCIKEDDMIKLLSYHNNQDKNAINSPLKKDAAKTAPYVKLLGMKKSSSILLRKIKEQKSEDFFMIQKPAHAKEILPPELLTLYEKEILASHLYQQIIYEKFEKRLPMEYQSNIIIV